MLAAFLGFLAVNSPLTAAYTALRDWRIGPAALDLHLSLGTWASDGLLAIFFFMVGLELKRELTVGALRRPAAALVPVGAAVGGVVVPALIYLAFTAGHPGAQGWAIPTATDIAFAVAVLGLVAPRIPPVLRVFLLTLAVVDDFIAIAIIAIAYSSGITWLWLGLALIPLLAYAWLAHAGAAWFARNSSAAWLTLLPIGIVVWGLVHASGIHATVAGVLLAFAVPVQQRRGPQTDLAHILSHRLGPLSNTVAVPIFAFFAAGVAIGDATGFPADPVAVGIILGLVVGKPLGISLAALLLTRLTHASLGDGVSMRQFIGVACLGGIGFTVALLITELSFTDPAVTGTAKLAVMSGSLISAVLAAILLVRPQPKR